MASIQRGALRQPALLTFLGAAGKVTGSRFLLEANGCRLLVDSGLFQGLRELRQLGGPIVSTRWTGELARVVLQDAAHLQEEEAAYANAKGFSKHRPAVPSCTGEDAAAVFELFRPADYHAPVIGRYVPVPAEVLELGAFCVHADAAELTERLRPVPVPDTGYLVHGEVAAANAVARPLGDELGCNAVVPSQGERARVER